MERSTAVFTPAWVWSAPPRPNCCPRLSHPLSPILSLLPPHPVSCWIFSSHFTTFFKCVLPILHSACKPHLHLTHLLLHCGQCSAPPLPPPLPSPLDLPEGPAALDALHTQPGTFAARLAPVWRCEAGLCGALTPVIVSPKCKAVAPSCGQVFSWEFYSGKVPDVSPQVHTADGWGCRQSWLWDTLSSVLFLRARLS